MHKYLVILSLIINISLRTGFIYNPVKSIALKALYSMGLFYTQIEDKITRVDAGSGMQILNLAVFKLFLDEYLINTSSTISLMYESRIYLGLKYDF